MADMRNLWVPVEVTIKRNPKFRRLSRLLGDDHNKILGMVVSLWSWTVEQTEDGIIESFDIEDIGDGIGCTGDDVTILITALTQCGWLDTNPLRIHNWESGAGKYRVQKSQNRDRQRAKRARDKAVTVTSRGSNGPSRIRGEERRVEEITGGGVTEALRHGDEEMEVWSE